MPTNFTSINGCGYFIPTCEPKTFAGHTINRYIVNNTGEDFLESTASAVTQLLADNPNLIYLSGETDKASLQAKINSDGATYLVINGRAVCITDQPEADQTLERKCRDAFFSGSIIREPVQCSQQHTFELEHIRAWIDKTGHNRCPYEGAGAHPVISEGQTLQVDTLLKDDIQTLMGRAEQALASAKKIQHLEHVSRAQEAALAEVAASKVPNRVGELTITSGKVVIKGGALIASHGGKSVSMVLKAFAKAPSMGGKAGTYVMKSLPVVGVFVGVAMAIWRVVEGVKALQSERHNEASGQFVKAGGELVSGVLAAFFPGIGTGVSIGLDLAMLTHDAVEMAGVIPEKPTKQELDAFHRVLQLDPEVEQSQELIDQAYRSQSLIFHPDHVDLPDDAEAKKEFTLIQSALNQAKAVLYKHYKYV